MLAIGCVIASSMICHRASALLALERVRGQSPVWANARITTGRTTAAMTTEPMRGEHEHRSTCERNGDAPWQGWKASSASEAR
jgi:hypothetical protein